MAHDWKQTAGHAIHIAARTETGKKVTKAVAGTAVAVATSVVGPTVVAAAVPVIFVAAIGYGIWSLFNDKNPKTAARS